MELEQLFNDPTFVNWALNLNEEDSLFWLQYLEDHPEQAEFILTARGRVISNHRPDNGVDLNEEWGKINERIGTGEHQRSRRNFLISTSAAALMLFGLFALWRHFFAPSPPIQLSQEVITQPGEIRTVVLPDGSSVTLNGRSSIHYPPHLDRMDHRVVAIEGEVFFHVVNNHTPFVVQLPNAEVKVLGTQFNVHTRTAQTRVSLLEGKVDVHRSSGEEIILQPGQSAYLDDKISVVEEDVADITSWKDGIWTFKDTPIAQLVERLHDDFGIEVLLADPSLLYRKISGKLSVSNPNVLYKALETLLDVRIDENAQGITIRNK